MNALLMNPASLVWLLLMLATAASTWWLSKDALSPVVGTIAILLIAMFKIRLVLWHFMELRHAPAHWRRVFDVWLLLVTIAVLLLYSWPSYR